MTSTLTLTHPLPDELVELIARRFRVLGEPMRIRLLDHLRDGEATVGELSDALGASQQNVSKHLAVLATRASSAAGRRARTSSTGSSTRACSPCARTSAGRFSSSCARSATSSGPPR